MDNPFALLGFEPAFGLDLDRLEARFLDASARCHPDRFSDPLDQADAADQMSRLTEAYQALRDPEQRAKALLRLRGEAANPDDKTLPPELLMEMMEVRESLDEAVTSGDAAEIERHRRWAEGKRADHLAALDKLFLLEAGEKNTAAIRLQLNGLRYIERMLEQMPGEDVD